MLEESMTTGYLILRGPGVGLFGLEKTGSLQHYLHHWKTQNRMKLYTDLRSHFEPRPVPKSNFNQDWET